MFRTPLVGRHRWQTFHFAALPTLPGDGFSTAEAESLGGRCDHFTRWRSTSTVPRSPLGPWRNEYTTELAQDPAVHGLDAEMNSRTFSPLRFSPRSTVKGSYHLRRCCWCPAVRPLYKGNGISNGACHFCYANANHGGIMISNKIPMVVGPQSVSVVSCSRSRSQCHR